MHNLVIVSSFIPAPHDGLLQAQMLGGSLKDCQRDTPMMLWVSTKQPNPRRGNVEPCGDLSLANAQELCQNDWVDGLHVPSIEARNHWWNNDKLTSIFRVKGGLITRQV